MRTLICHGDSLIEASDLDGPSTWPSRVARRLKINVINSGIGGDTTGGLLGRFYPEVVQQDADAVLIMGGTNDLKNTSWMMGCIPTQPVTSSWPTSQLKC
ncbi:MAG: GDSL-type esterase/lipase family protein [Desulfobacterales bacterium]